MEVINKERINLNLLRYQKQAQIKISKQKAYIFLILTVRIQPS